MLEPTPLTFQKHVLFVCEDASPEIPPSLSSALIFPFPPAARVRVEEVIFIDTDGALGLNTVTLTEAALLLVDSASVTNTDTIDTDPVFAEGTGVILSFLFVVGFVVSSVLSQFCDKSGRN